MEKEDITILLNFTIAKKKSGADFVEGSVAFPVAGQKEGKDPIHPR